MSFSFPLRCTPSQELWCIASPHTHVPVASCVPTLWFSRLSKQTNYTDTKNIYSLIETRRKYVFFHVRAPVNRQTDRHWDIQTDLSFPHLLHVTGPKVSICHSEALKDVSIICTRVGICMSLCSEWVDIWVSIWMREGLWVLNMRGTGDASCDPRRIALSCYNSPRTSNRCLLRTRS